MDFVERREANPEYLKTVIAQRQIVIEERERQISEQATQIGNLKTRIQELQRELSLQKQNTEKELSNLSMALKENENNNDSLKHEKSQLEFQLNVGRLKMQELQKQHNKIINKLKNDFESQKQSLSMTITKLEKNLTTLNTHYQVEEGINEDKHKIIEDANRNLRGFANQKQQRMIIIQNQQLSNEIEFQSRQITALLEKSEKLQDEIKQYKMDLQLHKNIQNDLVKRSSLAQNLIKQLNSRVKQLERTLEKTTLSNESKSLNQHQASQYSRVSEASAANKEIQAQLVKLKFQNANLKNYNHFLQTSQKTNNNKYQTLGEIMAQHLELLLLENKGSERSEDVTININSLKQKDLKLWSIDETEVVLQLLIAQIKPYLSKTSLISFPQVREIKVSFVEEQAKDGVSLPKIIEAYDKSYEKETKKTNRFKDIPVDISTKILRSNLRQWGTKVAYGQNIPRDHKAKSKSYIPEIDRSLM